VIIVDAVHHVAIGVTDLSRARQFYADVLGLQEIPRPPFDFDGAWFAAGRQQIHLIVRAPAAAAPADANLDTRSNHVALRVRSYRATLDHLKALSIRCVDRPRNKTPWPQIYVADPDGNVIELSAERLD
jgi:catechol 2,3-dioxygenase-like lactoylglutathione lyase family enzyme